MLKEKRVDNMKKIIIYDFDGTLTPDSIPKWECLNQCGFSQKDLAQLFGKLIQELQEDEDLYTKLYAKTFNILKEHNYPLDEESICRGSGNIKYNPGVESTLKTLKEQGYKHYLVSSGVKPYLAKIKIAPYFSDIYASTFKYNDNKVVGMDYIMSDTKKVLAIQDIMRKNNLKDCTNIIYLGDGLTDYPAFKFVKENHGQTGFVYQTLPNMELTKLEDANLISWAVPANFEIGHELYQRITGEI